MPDLDKHLQRTVRAELKRKLIKSRRFQDLLKARLDCLDKEEALFGNAPMMGSRMDLLSAAVKCAEDSGAGGLWLEFGVWRGASLNFIAGCTTNVVYGFDSFEGLPEDWVMGKSYKAKKGKRSLQGELPPVCENARLVKGLFENTLPDFLEKNPGSVSFVHIDSDLYQSAKMVLNSLIFREGTVIVFDEYYNYPSWDQGEYKAFQEFLAEKNWKAECIGYCPRSGQAGFILRRA